MNKNEIIFTPIQNKSLMAAASLLPTSGILKKSYDAQYVYLEVDDRFIYTLCPLIEQEESVEEPDYFSIGIGAHISVIYPNEILDPVFDFDLDKIFQFKIENFFRAESNEAVYFALTVSSPELMRIRETNQLGKKLNLNGFMLDMHITIGKIDKFLFR